MNPSARSRMLRIVMLLLLACTAWLAYDSNPNTIFRRLQRDFDQNHPTIAEINPLAVMPTRELQTAQQFYRHFETDLQNINPDRLSNKNKATYTRLQQQVAENLSEIHALQSDPSLYNLGGALKTSLSNDTLTLEQRLSTIHSFLKESSSYFAAAKSNLQQPDPEKTVLAIQKQLLTLNFLQAELLDSLARSFLSANEKEAFMERTSKAKIAVKDYLAFCRSLLFEQRDSVFNTLPH